MRNEIQGAVFNLLHLYAQIDFMIMEACGARIPYAPDITSKLALARQVAEERRHFTIQQRWLKRMGHPYREVIPSPLRDELMKEFTTLPWLDFMVAVQLTVEGIGIGAVHRVCEQADERVRQALRIPIRDERRQVSFGLKEVARAFSQASPEERERLESHINGIVRRVAEVYGELPLPVPQWFEETGIDYQKLRVGVWEDAAALFRQAGIELELPSA